MKKFSWILVILIVFYAKMSCADREWREFTKGHFIIYYVDAPKSFVETVQKSAEDYYLSITKDLGFTRYKGWNWEDRGKIYIYDNADDYVTTAKRARWSHGSASPRNKVIRTYPAAHGFFDSTLPHELTHIIFREFVGYRSAIPKWFEEGVAMYEEKAKRWGSDDVVRTAIKEGKFIPLKKLITTQLTSDTDREIVSLYYAESASAVYYLINEYGKHRFVNFCRKLQEGQEFQRALKNVYVRFTDLEKFNNAWIKTLR